jgi:hypothetical protein
MSRSLTPSERVAYDHVSQTAIDRARVRSLFWLPGGFKGLTLGRTIFLTTDEPSDGTSSLVAHELVHVQQYGDRGWIRFLMWYLSDFVRALLTERNWMRAYRQITAEEEARRSTHAWAQGRRT